MEIVNNTASGVYTNEYKSKNITKQTKEYSMKTETSKSNPRNATEIEMFALCNYIDAKGIGNGSTFGSWHTLNYYRDNATHNGYFELPDRTDSFKCVKQGWMKMVQLMMKDYMEAGYPFLGHNKKCSPYLNNRQWENGQMEPDNTLKNAYKYSHKSDSLGFLALPVQHTIRPSVLPRMENLHPGSESHAPTSSK